MTLNTLVGSSLGKRDITFGPPDAILYALAVGARADDLRLVYEAELRVLPSYATALGIWCTAAAADRGGYDQRNVLHVGQKLEMHRPLTHNETLRAEATVSNVYDKGAAAIVEITVSTEAFIATYTMFVPGQGGWGGERGRSVSRTVLPEVTRRGRYHVPDNAAALYRLTGDPHPVHIDPAVAHATGLSGPILHGLCTVGIVTREVTDLVGFPPDSLRLLDATIAAPVYPAQTLDIATSLDGTTARFEAHVGEVPVLRGTAEFAVDTEFPEESRC